MLAGASAIFLILPPPNTTGIKITLELHYTAPTFARGWSSGTVRGGIAAIVSARVAIFILLDTCVRRWKRAEKNIRAWPRIMLVIAVYAVQYNDNPPPVRG